MQPFKLSKGREGNHLQRIIPRGVEGAEILSVRADAVSLRNIPLFRNCGDLPLQVMAFAAERQNFASGQVLFKQGQTSAIAYFILSGSVELEQNKQKLGVAEPGSLLGELAMIGQASYSLTATALESVATVRIDNLLFKRVATEYPEFAQAVMEAMSDKLGASVRELDGVRGMLTKARSFSNL